MSLLKPLSKMYQNYQPNIILETKVSNLLDQGDSMPNKKFSYILESKSA